MKKTNNKIVIITSVISLLLLVAFSLLQSVSSKILWLDVKWLVVAGVPLIIGILYSGIIKTFKGFGIEFELNLAQPVKLNFVEKLKIYHTTVLTKDSLDSARDRPEQERHSIERLKFFLGRKGYYDSFAIIQYFNILPNLKFIEIVNELDEFRYLLPVDQFYFSRDNEEFLNRQGEERAVQLLINSIEENSLESTFRFAISDTINENDSIIDAYKKFQISRQGFMHSGLDQILPVINSAHKMKGIVRKRNLEEKIAKEVANSYKG